MRMKRRLGPSVVFAMLGLSACDSATKPPPPVANVVVGPGVALVSPGASQQYGVSVTTSSGRQLTDRTVVWSVSDTTVATVSASGLVTGRPNPTTLNRSVFVRATVEGKTGQAELLVRPSPAASVEIADFAGVLSDGQAPVLTATVRDAANNILVGRTVLWSSRDITTARVSNLGVLTPVAFLDPGNRTVRIVASVAGGAADSITVTVAPTDLVSMDVRPDVPFVQPGWTKTLRATGLTSLGSPVNAIPATFTSSNPAVASITSSGVVTAGASPGSTEIVANFGVFSDTVTLTVDPCGAAPGGTYPLEVRFYGPNPPTPSVEAAFTCAANRIRAIIRQPISQIDFVNTSIQQCIGEAVNLTETTTGLIIYARVDSIDGPGQVLGSAGPCFVRSVSRLPVLGVMRFDNADMANLESSGRLLDVILHEMLHVIGIGSTWRDNLLNPLRWTGDVPNPGFLGPRALAACAEEHGGSNVCIDRVPIEDCVAGVPSTCGQGTRLGHWREFTFDNELMTGYIEPAPIRNPFSRMTIEALADLGYTVDPFQSNDYLIPGASLLQALRAPGGSQRIEMPEPRLPLFEIDRVGRVRPLRPFR